MFSYIEDSAWSDPQGNTHYGGGKSMLLKIIRVPTVENVPLCVEFDKSGYQFLVKNFTEKDIYVSFDKDINIENMAIIAPDAAQVVGIANTSKVYITPEATSSKGVEVQCLR